MVIQKRTRQQIRQSIGYNLGALHIGSATSTGNTTTLTDTLLYGGNDVYNGRYVWFYNDATQSTIREVERRISDYTSGGTVTLQTLPATTTDNDKYEMWDGYSPTQINEFINQSILDVTGQVYDVQESLSLHSDKYNSRFDLPSDFAMVNKIEMRDKMQWTSLHNCETAFDSNVTSTIVASIDTEDKKQGSGSMKLVTTDAYGGDIAGDTYTAKDISKYDYLECWIKSTVATSSGNLKIHLHSAAITEGIANSGSLESLNVPALTADTWTYVRIALANPETDTAIIAIALEHDADLADCQIRLDDIRVVASATITWETVPNQLWTIDKSARQIVFRTDGVSYMGYKLLKITGGDKPALLTSDSDQCEIDDGYVINKATSLALSATSGGPATDPDQKRQQAAFYYGLSEQNKRAFPNLINVRVAS